MKHEPFFFIQLVQILILEGYAYQSLDQFYFIKACSDQLNLVEDIYIYPGDFTNSLHLVSNDKLIDYAQEKGLDVELLKIEAAKIKASWLKAYRIIL
jgi:hypothetical protein